MYISAPNVLEYKKKKKRSCMCVYLYTKIYCKILFYIRNKINWPLEIVEKLLYFPPYDIR